MQNFKVTGGKKLSGEITVNTSKNAAVALLAGSVLNSGVTTLLNVPDIEEVNRLIEILESIGMEVVRKGKKVTIKPIKLDVSKINKKSAMRTRSAILLIGALSRSQKSFKIPQAGGCRLGTRTVTPHAHALAQFGVQVKVREKDFQIKRGEPLKSPKRFALYESGDTVTENALFVAAQTEGITEIRFASANYMVQDVCFFLEKCGVKIEGIGTTTLRVHGVGEIKKDVTYSISEDPIEAMLFMSIAIVTKSKIIVRRCPFDFIELELTKLKAMGLGYEILKEYKARNRKTTLVDIKFKSFNLKALAEKIEARPFPALNMDNLPFFAVIGAVAEGKTLIHDWPYENRAVYLKELSKFGVSVTLIDEHRVVIEGPTKFKSAEVSCPPALRPGAVLLVAMLRANGTSILRDIYMINRGYEDLAGRLQTLGAKIEIIN